MDLKELQKLIKPAFSKGQLAAGGVPEEDAKIFLNYKVFPVDILVKADWNYKTDDEGKSAKLRENMKRNGQVENIQVRLLETGFYEVVNGNHRLDDARAIGKRFLVAYDHGKISLAQAQRIAIETNETKFDSNHMLLSSLISELSQEFDLGDLALTLPFSEEDLAGMIELTEFEWDSSLTQKKEKPGTGQGKEGGEGLEQLVLAVPYETLELWFSAKARLQNEFPELETEAQVLEHCLHTTLAQLPQDEQE